MHIWDTFVSHCTWTGLQCDNLFLGKFLNHLVGCQRILLPTAAQKKP